MNYPLLVREIGQHSAQVAAKAGKIDIAAR